MHNPSTQDSQPPSNLPPTSPILPVCTRSMLLPNSGHGRNRTQTHWRPRQRNRNHRRRLLSPELRPTTTCFSSTGSPHWPTPTTPRCCPGPYGPTSKALLAPRNSLGWPPQTLRSFPALLPVPTRTRPTCLFETKGVCKDRKRKIMKDNER